MVRSVLAAVLVGLHPLKHALRFGAEVSDAVSGDVAALDRLASRIAPDVRPWLGEHVVEVAADELARRAAPAGLSAAPDVVAAARRPDPALAAALLAGAPPPGAGGAAPVVVLDGPRHLGNVGAAVRVAAAAGAAGVLTLGAADPWHPAALRGGAGLQFALPVARLDALPATLARPLVALDPAGARFDPGRVPPDAMLAFGAERHGLSAAVRERADAVVALPMRPGVSSLNLATAVAAVLYALVLGR